MTIKDSVIALKLDEIKSLLKADDLSIPLSIFANTKFALLESLVLHLRDTMGMRNSEVAQLLNRSEKSITQAYRNGRKKRDG